LSISGSIAENTDKFLWNINDNSCATDKSLIIKVKTIFMVL